MYDAIGVEVGEGQGYIVTKVHLDVEGEWLFRELQESGQTLSMSSISSTGSPDSGSLLTPKYCTMLGCRTPLRN